VIHVRVAGGTNAGRKRPLRAPARDWHCRCLADVQFGADAVGEPAVARNDRGVEVKRVVAFKRQPGRIINCPDCGTRRPDA
jgi:hypothetical protein